MHLTDLIKNFHGGNFRLVMPKATLLQNTKTNAKSYAGPAVVSLDDSRKLTYEMYLDTPASGFQALREIFEKPPATQRLVSEDEYFTFNGTDLQGRTWTAERVDEDSSSGPGGTVLTGGIHTLTSIYGKKGTGPALRLFCGKNFEIPCSGFTERFEKVDGETSFAGAVRNRTKFTFDNLTFTLVQEQDRLRVECEGQSLQRGDHLRIQEALQFVLGKSVPWNISIHHDLSGSRITLHSAEPSNGQLDPPLRFKSADQFGGQTWMLFERYFRFVRKHPIEDEHHPVSNWISAIRRSNDGYAYAAGLTLGVGIEGVLTECFPHLGEPTESDKASRLDLRKHIVDWAGNKTLQQRALGAVDAMARLRPKDRFYRLVELGKVRQKDVEAWSKLRNAAAHATPPKDKELEGWIQDCDKSLVLLHHIIFAAIGYAGIFCDYSEPPWNPKAVYGMNEITQSGGH